MNSRAKGQRAERAWRDELRAAGWISARRGQQFEGSSESPDVVCDELNGFHFEVKHSERGNPFVFLAQALADAGPTKIPTVAMRRNRQGWIVALRAADFLNLVRVADLAALHPILTP